MNDRQKLIAGAGIFVFIFLLSLIIFKLSPDDIQYRVLFFPTDESNTLIGETRRLKDRGKLEKDVKVLLEEILLGPSVLAHNRYIPKGTRVQSVLLRKSVVYVDFSGRLQQITMRHASGTEEAPAAAGEVIQRDTLPLDLPEALAIVRKTIKFNFPVIREVVFTIDGEIPVFGETAEGGAE